MRWIPLLLLIGCASTELDVADYEGYEDCAVGMDDVDWQRVLGVKSRAVDQTGDSHTWLGDPTNWGHQTTVVMPAGVEGGLNRSDTLIRAQCKNPYPRAWQLAGTLDASNVAWATAPGSWDQALEISMGVGQSTIVHRLSVRNLCALALASTAYLGISNGPREVRPFIVSGGITAAALSVRVLTGYTGIVPETFTTNLILTPIAAGGY